MKPGDEPREAAQRRGTLIHQTPSADNAPGVEQREAAWRKGKFTHRNPSADKPVGDERRESEANLLTPTSESEQMSDFCIEDTMVLPLTSDRQTLALIEEAQRPKPEKAWQFSKKKRPSKTAGAEGKTKQDARNRFVRREDKSTSLLSTPGTVLRGRTASPRRTASESPVGELPIRRLSWIAVGGGYESDQDLVRISNDDLQEAALRGDVGLVRRLVHSGASVNSPMRPENEDDFLTLLHVLASKPDVPNSTRLLGEIVGMRANLDARSTSGVTPLCCACSHNHVGAVEVLLGAKASPQPVDDHGRNALVCAIEAVPTPTELASEQMSSKMSKWAPEQCVEIIGLLSKANADLNNGGDKEVMLAAIEGQQEVIVRGLIKLGVEPVNFNDAVENAPVGVIMALVDAQANPFVRTKGRTPMDIALARKEPDVLTLLRNYIGDLQRLNHPFLETQKEELALEGMAEMQIASKVLSIKYDGDPFEEVEVKSRWRLPKGVIEKLKVLQAPARKLNRSKWYQAFMLSLLVWALLLPDLWIIFDIVSTDGLDAILIVILLTFMFEIGVQLVGLWKNYICTFFFWMDIIGILAVPLDHSFISGKISGGISDNAVVLRATRMAKLGARAGRFTKLLKLLRFLPGIREQGTHVGSAKVLSSKLNFALSTRVSCLIIVMVMILPVFELFSFPLNDFSMRAWVGTLQSRLGDHSIQIDDLVGDFQDFYAERNYYPFKLHCVDSNGSAHDFELAGKRPARDAAITRIQVGEAYALFNFEQPIQTDSLCNVIMMFTIILLIVGSAFLLSNSVSGIVIVPLELFMFNIGKISRTLFHSLAAIARKKPLKEHESGGRLTTTNQEEDDEFDDECLDEDALENSIGNETQGLELVLKKLVTISEIFSQKKEERTEEERAMLMEYTQDHGDDADKSGSESDASHGDIYAMIEDYLEEIDISYQVFRSWEFDVFSISEEQRQAACFCAITEQRCISFEESCGEERTWGDVCMNFVEAIVKGHDDENPYHNFIHAADVCCTTSHFLQVSGSEHYLSNNERLALVVGAVAHDLGHPGFNNAFLIETSHELALRYNDQSPLENMHCAALFEILVEKECAILCDLPVAAYKEVRHILIEAVLHTDFACHPMMTKEIQALYDINHELFDVAEEMYGDSGGESFPSAEVIDFFKGADAKKLIRNMVIHFCDISNALKDWDVNLEWAKLIHEEFFSQGDREKELGFPVQPLFDREKANLPLSQIGWIDFFVAPLAIPIEKLLPPLDVSLDELIQNFGRWIDEWIDVTDPKPDDDEQSKVRERLTKLEAKRM